MPLRPIVSFVNSPTHNLSKFLSRVLSSLLKNNYSVRNSQEFVECIKNYSVEENECLVSFDVVSLFTSVPVDKALALVLELLASDDSLSSRTRLSISDIKQGLQICLDSTVFSYKKSFFKQTFGTPMGSCISPIIANLYMEHIEHTAITTFHTPPNLWLRYVNDTFCILDKKHMSEFHSHLNSICSHIQFTMENEHDFSLPLLDVLVSRNVCKENHTSLTTAIYKKPTHTDRYLHYTSHHPKHQKLTVTKTLLNRVETHISHTDENQKSGELRNIRSTLQLNGFPTRATFLSRKNKRSQTQNSQFKQFTSIPYVQGTSDRIRRVLNEAGVGVAMRPVKTIRHILPSPKDPYTTEDKSCVVYQIPCSDCDYVYIGQTKRGLKSRLADHRRATSQLRPELSALCEHAMDFNHTIDWEKSEILKVENNYSKRLISEAWFINAHPKVMNRSDGDSLPNVYRSLAK